MWVQRRDSSGAAGEELEAIDYAEVPATVRWKSSRHLLPKWRLQALHKARPLDGVVGPPRLCGRVWSAWKSDFESGVLHDWQWPPDRSNMSCRCDRVKVPSRISWICSCRIDDSVDQLGNARLHFCGVDATCSTGTEILSPLGRVFLLGGSASEHTLLNLACFRRIVSRVLLCF